jgi:predicted transcriptional regulator
MPTTTEALCDGTVRDVMTPDVVKLRQDMSLREAANVLSQAQISGAPVVDYQGKCIGVLSATDFVRCALNPGVDSTILDRVAHNIPVDWQLLPAVELPVEPVRKYMTRDVVTIGPEASIRYAARLMLDAHIHRLMVVDAQDRPIGILSSTNILAAVAYADK